MGKVNPPKKVKLICGMLSSDEELFTAAAEELIKKFGPLDSKSEIIDFSHTNYYKKEMGENIKRFFISFENIIHPPTLVDAKLFTQDLEEKYIFEGRRLINLDPGYISEGKLVLATTKDQQHRIYMDRGIYAEVTLRFVGKEYTFWDWTYPDYKTKEYTDYLRSVRDKLRRQMGRRMTNRKSGLKKLQE